MEGSGGKRGQLGPVSEARRRGAPGREETGRADRSRTGRLAGDVAQADGSKRVLEDGKLRARANAVQGR